MKLRLGLGFSDPHAGARNAAPTDILLSASSIAENNSVNAVVGALSVTDAGDAGPWTYELVSGTGSTDNASFNISGSNLRIGIAANYESKNSYSVRIRATDSGGLFFEKAFMVSITNVNEAPTNITLSNASVPEDLAVGLSVGTLTTTDPDAGNTFVYTITTDADNKFDISGDQLIIDHALDYETKTSHDVTVRSTDQGGLHYDKIFTITVTDVSDETTTPPLDPAAVTPVYSGTFDVVPVVNKHNGKAKAQGKVSSIATMILSIGSPAAGTTYIARVDPDFSLLSHQGKDAMLGFGFKEGNNFHIVGLKGNGSTGLNKAKLSGNWNGLNGATLVTNGAPANGTQAGPNWLKIAIASDGSTYTFSTGTGTTVDDVVWTAEYTAVTPSPLTNATDAAAFGIAAYFPASDIGQFSIEIDAWTVQVPKTLAYIGSGYDAGSKTTYTFTGFTINASDSAAQIAVGLGGGNSSRTVSSVKVHVPDIGTDPTGTLLGCAKQSTSGGSTSAFYAGKVAVTTTFDVSVVWSGSQANACGVGVWTAHGYSDPIVIEDTEVWVPVDGGGVTKTMDSDTAGFLLDYSFSFGTGDQSSTWDIVSGLTSLTERFDGGGTSPRHSGADGVPSGTSASFKHTCSNGGNGNAVGVAITIQEKSGSLEARSVSFRSSAQSSTDTNSYSFSSMDIGTAHANRRIAVMVGLVNGDPPTAVTVGGVSLERVARKDNGAHVVVDCWMGVVPTGTSATVVVSCTGTASLCGVGVWACQGLSNNIPHDSQGWLPADSSGVNVTLATINGGYAIAASMALGSAAATSVWTSITERYDAAAEGNWQHSGASITTSGSSLSFNETTTTGGNSNVAGLAVSF